MKTNLIVFLTALFLYLQSPISAVALPVTNSDFSSGLTGWSSSGDVSVVSSEAVLSDDLDFFGTLFQSVAIGAAGNYTFSFDFQNNISAEIPDFTFPDIGFVSVIESAAQVTDPGSHSSTAMFDTLGGGVEDVFAGEISASSKGGTWEHFSWNFATTAAYITPVFDLLDGNFIFADSTFLIDNVEIVAQEPIPEPATATLLALGALGLRRFRSSEQ